jgi:hypothetical protein
LLAPGWLGQGGFQFSNAHCHCTRKLFAVGTFNNVSRSMLQLITPRLELVALSLDVFHLSQKHAEVHAALKIVIERWRLSCFCLMLKVTLRHGSHLRENSARAELLNFILDATELATQPAGYWVLAHVFDSFALCA